MGVHMGRCGKTLMDPILRIESLLRDVNKLDIMKKRAADSLYKDGFPPPVILIHGQGMDIGMYKIKLLSKAFYRQDQGSLIAVRHHWLF